MWYIENKRNMLYLLQSISSLSTHVYSCSAILLQIIIGKYLLNNLPIF